MFRYLSQLCFGTVPDYWYRMFHLSLYCSSELRFVPNFQRRITIYTRSIRSGLNWVRKLKKRCFKNQMSVIWSWTYFYYLHWNNYLYFKGLLYIWEEMIMMTLLHMAGLENSKCIWKIQFSSLWPLALRPIGARLTINVFWTGSGCIRFNDCKVDQMMFAEYSCPIRLRGAR